MCKVISAAARLQPSIGQAPAPGWTAISPTRSAANGYAKEDLRAEIASLMIGDQLSIGHDPGQHAAYVGLVVTLVQKVTISNRLI